MTGPGEHVRIGETAFDVVDYVAHAQAIMDGARQTFDVDAASLADDFMLFNNGNQTEAQEVEVLLGRQKELEIGASSDDSTERWRALQARDVTKVQYDAINTARVFVGFGGRLAREIVPEIFDESPSTEITEQLQAQGRDPFEAMIRWQTAADVLLHRSASIFKATSTLRKRFSNDVQALIRQDSKHRAGRPNDEIPGVHAIITSLEEKAEQALGRTGGKIVDLYRKWQDAVRLRDNSDIHQVLTTLNSRSADILEAKKAQEQAQQVTDKERIQLAAEKLVTRYNGFIEAQDAQARPFRTNWSQVQKAGLREFNTGLLALTRRGEIRVDPRDQTDVAKRITGVLRSLELFGQRERLGHVTPEEMVGRFAARLTTDREVTDELAESAASLSQVKNIRFDLNAWLPVGDDLDFIQAHWGKIQPLIKDKWGVDASARSQAAADIDMARKRYIQAKNELEHPEQRLMYIARPLGAVALPPEARPQIDDGQRERKRRASQEAIREITRNQANPEDIRMRAEVIDRIMDVASAQRTPEDDPDFGDLFLSKPSESHNVRYFCVTFRDDAGNEWALLESLSKETASYVVPMDIARSFGTLSEFVSGFGKTDQLALGSKKVIHRSGWTPDSHLTAMYAKMAAPSENDTGE